MNYKDKYNEWLAFADENTKAELIKLLSDLDECTDVKYCPHGRPISLVMTKKEIEKHFKRT